MSGEPELRPRTTPSPGQAMMALGVGHAVWGSIAYRKPLRAIGRAGYLDSVGDGLLNKRHSRDERAAAFWFMAIAPLTVLTGYLAHAAFREGDREAVTVAGGSTVALSLAGMAAIPRSGFPAGIALGAWMLNEAGRLPARPDGQPR